MVTRETIVELSPFSLLIPILWTVNAAVLDVPDTVSQTKSGTVYTLHTVKQTWLDARRICRHGNGYLINLGTEVKYKMYEDDLKNGAFKDKIDRPWVGLYWSSTTSRHWDSPGCPPPQVTMPSNYKWRSSNDYTFSGEHCYRDHDGFEDRDCSEKNTFICESPSVSGCSYTSSIITSFITKTNVGGAVGLDNCKNYCDSQNGCFLVGVHGLQCVAMMARDVSNDPVALKQCPSEEKIETTQVMTISTDDTGNPTECFTETSSSVFTTSSVELSSTSSSSLSSACPTVTTTTVETVTVSETITTTDMDISSRVATETVTEIYNYTETVTETVSMSGSDSIQVTTVTQTSCETPSEYLTVSIQSCSQSSSLIVESSSQISSPNSTSSILESSGSLSASFSDLPGIIGEDGVLRTRVCRNVIVVTPDPVMTSEAVKSIVNELTVDKKNISAVVQKKVSTKDERKSSTAIGYAGIVFLIVPLLLIIVVDVPICIDGGKNFVRLLKS